MRTVDTEAMNPLKARLGVPAALRSCHTARMAGEVLSFDAGGHAAVFAKH